MFALGWIIDNLKLFLGLMVSVKERPGITKIIRPYPLGTLNNDYNSNSVFELLWHGPIKFISH